MINRIRSRFYSWEGVPAVFIVSTGRTATSFFSHFFDDNFPSVFARHEPPPDLFDLGVQFHRKHDAPSKQERLVKHSRYAVYRAFKATGKNIYLESNNNAALLLPTVKQVFPDLKIVWVTRDPRNYLVSAYSKVHGNPGYQLYGPKDPRPRLTANDLPDDPAFAGWDALSRFEKLCWHWKTYNRLIEASLDASTPHLALKYEDLFLGDDFQAMRKLIAFVGVVPEEQPNDEQLSRLIKRRSNQSDAYQLPSFNEWDDEQKAGFQRILGSEMARYGYAENTAPGR